MKQLIAGSHAECKSRIWLLDLDPIMVKLMDKKEGKGWTLEQALLAVGEYRRFLFLTVTREETIVPTEFVDAVWHAHILDTMKYAKDCEEIFGFFLHHFPYFGMRGEEDQATLQSTFRASAGIYEAAFGQPYYVGLNGANCGTCGPNACGSCAGSGLIPPQKDVFRDVVRSDHRPVLAIA
ncbi:MAG: hypothetical protein U0517_02420 [Candidatus Andersenbacteria bacterium]